MSRRTPFVPSGVPSGAFVQQVTGLSSPSADNAAIIQAAHDALPATGGILDLPASTSAAPFIVGQVFVTKPNVTIRLNGTYLLHKTGLGNAFGNVDRGMFTLAGLQPANFRLAGVGTIDLNRANYVDNTPNSAVMAVRCTYLYADAGVKIIGSTDAAYLARNCAHVYVYSDIDNCYGTGLEISLPADDDGTGIGDKYTLYRPLAGNLPASPFPEWFVYDGEVSNVDNGLFGAGDGIGMSVAGTAVGKTARHVRARMRARSNARDFHHEQNGAGSHAEDIKLDIQSDSPVSGSVGLVNVIGADVTVMVRNPGKAGTIAAGGDIYAVVVSGTQTDNITIDVECVDDRASAVDYAPQALLVNACKNLIVRRAQVVLAANAAQAHAPAALDLHGVSVSCQLGPLDLRITNPPAATVAVKNSGTAGAYKASNYAFSGWATNWSNSDPTTAAQVGSAITTLLHSGLWVAQPHTTRTTLVTVADRLYLNRFPAMYPITFDRVGLEITAGGATRTVADGVLNSTTTITSATAAFVAGDVGKLVTGTGIPAGTWIQSVTNGTTVVLSAAATATASGVTLVFAAAARFGAFFDNQGYPSTLLLDTGPIDATGITAGSPTAATISRLVAAGGVWLGVVFQGGTPTVRATATGLEEPPTSAASILGSARNVGLFQTVTAGAALANATPSTSGVSPQPLTFVRGV